jgi:hypothetical protein
MLRLSMLMMPTVRQRVMKVACIRPEQALPSPVTIERNERSLASPARARAISTSALVPLRCRAPAVDAIPVDLTLAPK